MTKTNYKNKNRFIQAEKKIEKLYYRIIVGLAILAVLYFYFIEPKTIGHDSRYTLFIVALPTFLGMLILGISHRQYLINSFTKNRGIVLWSFMIFFYLAQGIIISYLSFGQVAKISWDFFNNKAVEQNSEEIFDCKITRFWTGKRSSIDFIFNNKHESIKVNYSKIKEYENKNVEDYTLKIRATRGLWNYYKLNDWNIVHK